MIDIKTQIEAEIFTITLDGEVDASSSIHLDNALEQAMAESKRILVNTEKLKYISSAGLGVFISHLDDIQQREIRMVLCGMDPNVEQVFSILGLQDLLTIVKTEEEALALLV